MNSHASHKVIKFSPVSNIIGSEGGKNCVAERAPHGCNNRQALVVGVAAVGEQNAYDAAHRVGAYLSSSVSCSEAETAWCGVNGGKALACVGESQCAEVAAATVRVHNVVVGVPAQRTRALKSRVRGRRHSDAAIGGANGSLTCDRFWGLMK